MGRIYSRDGRYGIDFVDQRGHRVRKVVSADRGVALATWTLTVMVDSLA